MDPKTQLVLRTAEQFRNIQSILQIQDRSLKQAAEDYVHVAIAIEDTQQKLLVAEVDGGTAVRLVKFQPIAAAGFLAGLVGGIAGASSAIVLGAAILSSIASVWSLFEGASDAEAALFWVVYTMKDHEGTRSAVQEGFQRLAQEDMRLHPDDFPAALQGLFDMGVLIQHGEVLQLADKLVFLWMRE